MNKYEQRRRTATWLYGLQFAFSALYCLFLERVRSIYEPSLTWLTVVAGFAIVLAVPFLMARRLEGVYDQLVSWRDYEMFMALSVVVSAIPVLTWQILILGRWPWS